MTNDTAVAAAKDRALAAFGADGAAHRNCAQAVMLFMVTLLDEDPGVLEYARYLGGGVGRSGLACGALTGAALALALRDRRDPETWADRAPEGCGQLQDLARRFQERFGQTECRPLTGCDLSTAAGQERFQREDVRRQRCFAYVGWTCDQLAAICDV